MREIGRIRGGGFVVAEDLLSRGEVDAIPQEL